MKIVDINGNVRDCVKILPDLDWPGYMKAEITDKRGTHPEWYLINEFVKFNPNLKNLTNGAPKAKEEDFGIVTECKTHSLTDKNKVWENDIFIGTPIWIARGRGEGQVRTVISNSKNSVIIDKAWEIVPDRSSQYVISVNVHNPNAFGNSIPTSYLAPTKVDRNSKVKSKGKS